jgi:hypothetical protein
MKTISYVIIFILLFGLFSSNDMVAGNGPTDPMSLHSWTINLGIGPGINYYSGYPTGFGPGFQAAFETGMWKLGPGVLTLGAELGFTYFNYSYGDPHNSYKYTWFSVVTAARCAYHYGWDVPGLDTYGGLATGFRFLSFTATYDNNYVGGYAPASVYFFPGFLVGASYFFGPVFGVNGEVGYNTMYAQIGVIFKVK